MDCLPQPEAVKFRDGPGMRKNEEFLSWLGGLDSSQRLEVFVQSFRMAVPMEVRFLSQCLEELALIHYAQFRESEKRVNDPRDPHISTQTNLTLPATRITLISALSLLHGSNKTVAARIFRIIYSLRETSLESLGGAEAMEELKLLLTMAKLHPAFKFDQKREIAVMLQEMAGGGLSSRREDPTPDTQPSTSLQEKEEIVGREEEEEELEVVEASELRKEEPTALESQLSSSAASCTFDDPETKAPPVYVTGIEPTTVIPETPDGKLLFKLEVEWSNGQSTEVTKSAADLYIFHRRLLDLFPSEAGCSGRQRSIPYFPCPQSDSSQQEADVIKYIEDLRECSNRRVLGCVSTCEFFGMEDTMASAPSEVDSSLCLDRMFNSNSSEKTSSSLLSLALPPLSHPPPFYPPPLPIPQPVIQPPPSAPPNPSRSQPALPQSVPEHHSELPLPPDVYPLPTGLPAQQRSFPIATVDTVEAMSQSFTEARDTGNRETRRARSSDRKVHRSHDGHPSQLENGFEERNRDKGRTDWLPFPLHSLIINSRFSLRLTHLKRKLSPFSLLQLVSMSVSELKQITDGADDHLVKELHSLLRKLTDADLQRYGNSTGVQLFEEVKKQRPPGHFRELNGVRPVNPSHMNGDYMRLAPCPVIPSTSKVVFGLAPDDESWDQGEMDEPKMDVPFTEESHTTSTRTEEGPEGKEGRKFPGPGSEPFARRGFSRRKTYQSASQPSRLSRGGNTGSTEQSKPNSDSDPANQSGTAPFKDGWLQSDTEFPSISDSLASKPASAFLRRREGESDPRPVPLKQTSSNSEPPSKSQSPVALEDSFCRNAVTPNDAPHGESEPSKGFEVGQLGNSTRESPKSMNNTNTESRNHFRYGNGYTRQRHPRYYPGLPQRVGSVIEPRMARSVGGGDQDLDLPITPTGGMPSRGGPLLPFSARGPGHFYSLPLCAICGHAPCQPSCPYASLYRPYHVHPGHAPYPPPYGLIPPPILPPGAQPGMFPSFIGIYNGNSSGAGVPENQGPPPRFPGGGIVSCANCGRTGHTDETCTSSGFNEVSKQGAYRAIGNGIEDERGGGKGARGPDSLHRIPPAL